MMEKRIFTVEEIKEELAKLEDLANEGIWDDELDDIYYRYQLALDLYEGNVTEEELF